MVTTVLHSLCVIVCHIGALIREAIISSLQLANSSTLLSPVTIPQVVAVNKKNMYKVESLFEMSGSLKELYVFSIITKTGVKTKDLAIHIIEMWSGIQSKSQKLFYHQNYLRLYFEIPSEFH